MRCIQRNPSAFGTNTRCLHTHGTMTGMAMIYEELQEDLQAAKVPLVESIVAFPRMRWKKNLQLVRQNSCFVRCTWPKEMHALLESTGGNVGKCGVNVAMPKANRSFTIWCNFKLMQYFDIEHNLCSGVCLSILRFEASIHLLTHIGL